MARRHRKATFPRLRHIREELLHWEVTELAAKLPDGKPGLSSIYRLEEGFPIRLINVHRIFDVVAAALAAKGTVLDRDVEIVRKD